MRSTTKWDMCTTESGNAISVLFKQKNESVAVIVAASVSSKEAKITSDKEVNNLEERNDKEKLWMVVERMANEIRVESFSCQRRQPNFGGKWRTKRAATKA